MKEPKVTFKKIKTFRGMEGIGLNADMYINGVFCYFIIDSGDGGQMDFQPNIFEKNTEKVIEQIKLLNDYVATLPEKELPSSLTKGETFKIKVDLEVYVNDLLLELENEKHKKKMQKLMETCILFGAPDGLQYSFYNYKQPLFTFSTNVLQTLVNQIKRKHCTNEIVILNTNLEKYGVVI
jgi:hypothetical protein